MKSTISLTNYLVLIFFLMLFTGCTKIQPRTTDLTKISTKEPTEFTYHNYADVLAAYVNDNGLVAYRQLVKKPTQLNLFYAQIAAYSPDSHPWLFPSQNHKLAYWINAYNATVLKGVIEYYPISSIEDVQAPTILFFFPSKSGFFLFQRFTYGGQETSLYYLENSVIRERFNEPRIHFALNCASQSCPKLPRIPFSGEELDRQLDAETRKFINDPTRVRYDASSDTLYLSSIFEWYEEDFTDWLKVNKTGEKQSLLTFVLHYLSIEISQQIKENGSSPKLKFLPYNWGLNDIKL